MWCWNNIRHPILFLDLKEQEFAAKEKLEIVSGAAPPPFRIFAGGLPRRRRRRNAFGLIQEYCTKKTTSCRGRRFSAHTKFLFFDICLKFKNMVYNIYMPDKRMKISSDFPEEEEEEKEEGEEKEEESIWKFYFQSRWQTGLTTHFLFAITYLILFYIGNLWVAAKFAFYTFVSSAQMLGLEFALWGIIFEISIIVPFFASWYSILLLPNIWRSNYAKLQKVFLTILMITVIIMFIVIADTVARYALEANVLHEFVDFYSIEM